MTNQSYQGEYTLFTVIYKDYYICYQAVTIQNTDPFQAENWIGGANKF